MLYEAKWHDQVTDAARSNKDKWLPIMTARFPATLFQVTDDEKATLMLILGCGD